MAKVRPIGKTPSNIEQSRAAATPAVNDRLRMIAEAAYFRAANRGFMGGDPVADWLAAEAEINRRITGAGAHL